MKYTAEAYKGTHINQFMEWVGVQIVATDEETGKRRYVFEVRNMYRTYKSPCLKLGEWASHYITGMNKRDGEAFQEKMKEAEALAKLWNERGTHETETR